MGGVDLVLGFACLSGKMSTAAPMLARICKNMHKGQQFINKPIWSSLECARLSSRLELCEDSGMA